MVVHLYAILWNEEYMLPYFFRHYDQFVDRYVLYDNESTDASRAIIESNEKAELRTIRFLGESVCEHAKDVKNQCWKESRGVADWVVVVDVDEHVYHPGMRGYLSEQANACNTIINPVGYDMVAEDRPVTDARLADVLRMGVRNTQYDKVIFDPNCIEEINYSEGAHRVNPTGIVRCAVERPFLLHYKYLGRRETYNRNRVLGERLGVKDVANRWGWEYFVSEEQFNAVYDKRVAAAKQIF